MPDNVDHVGKTIPLICACILPKPDNTVSNAVITVLVAVDNPVKGAIRVAASALVLVKYRLDPSDNVEVEAGIAEVSA